MRHVLRDMSEVAHRFAHPEMTGDYASAGNITVNGDSCYSYGHYCIARITDREREIMLVTADRYSISTARHINAVTLACSHFTQYTVPDVHATNQAAHYGNWQFLRSEINSAATKFIKMPRQYDFDILQERINRANSYAATFKLQDWGGVVECKLPPSCANYQSMIHGQEMIDNAAAALRAARSDAERAASEQAAEIAAVHHNKRLFWSRFLPWVKTPASYYSPGRYHQHSAPVSRRDTATACAEWRNGEGSTYAHIAGHNYSEGALLRIDPNDAERVQTSGGVRVSLVDANMLWQYIVKIKERGTDRTYPRGGKMLGAYNIRAISAGGDLKVDCHKILWAEIDRFAVTQGWRSATMMERAGGLLRRAA